jgi:hypothetical protein
MPIHFIPSHPIPVPSACPSYRSPANLCAFGLVSTQSNTCLSVCQSIASPSFCRVSLAHKWLLRAFVTSKATPASPHSARIVGLIFFGQYSYIYSLSGSHSHTSRDLASAEPAVFAAVRTRLCAHLYVRGLFVPRLDGSWLDTPPMKH